MNNFHLSTGIGHSTGGNSGNLMALDAALRNAEIGDFVLLEPQSLILPPNVELVQEIDLEPGSILHTTMAVAFSYDRYKAFATAVAIGIPRDKSQVGVILKETFTATQRPRFALAETDLRELLPAWRKKMTDDVANAMRSRRIDCEDILVSIVAEHSCELIRTLDLGTYNQTPVTALVAAVSLW